MWTSISIAEYIVPRVVVSCIFCSIWVDTKRRSPRRLVHNASQMVCTHMMPSMDNYFYLIYLSGFMLDNGFARMLDDAD